MTNKTPVIVREIYIQPNMSLEVIKDSADRRYYILNTYGNGWLVFSNCKDAFDYARRCKNIEPIIEFDNELDLEDFILTLND